MPTLIGVPEGWEPEDAVLEDEPLEAAVVDELLEDLLLEEQAARTATRPMAPAIVTSLRIGAGFLKVSP